MNEHMVSLCPHTHWVHIMSRHYLRNFSLWKMGFYVLMPLVSQMPLNYLVSGQVYPIYIWEDLEGGPVQTGEQVVSKQQHLEYTHTHTNIYCIKQCTNCDLLFGSCNMGGLLSFKDYYCSIMLLRFKCVVCYLCCRFDSCRYVSESSRCAVLLGTVIFVPVTNTTGHSICQSDIELEE